MAQPTLVQNSGLATSSGSTTTITLTGVTSGNFLVVQYLAQSSGSVTPTLADSNGTLVTAINTTNFGTGTNVRAYIAYVAAANSGTHVFTLTAAATARPSIGAAQEFSGVSASPLDQHAVNGGTTAQTQTSGTTPATTAATELVIACIGISSSTGSASMGLTDPPSGFASLAVSQNDSTSTNLGGEMCYQVVTSIGTQGTSWSWTDASTRASASAIATFFSTAAVIQPPIPLGGLPRVQMHWR